jgi:hypothetical protein
VHRSRLHEVKEEHHLQVRERVQPGEGVRLEAGLVEPDQRLDGVPVVVERLAPPAADGSHRLRLHDLHTTDRTRAQPLPNRSR